jgi:hypothetical protein
MIWVMNVKNPDGLSIIMDLGLSHQYAQVLSVPLKIFSNMTHKIARRAIYRKEGTGTPLSNKLGHMARSVCKM